MPFTVALTDRSRSILFIAGVALALLLAIGLAVGSLKEVRHRAAARPTRSAAMSTRIAAPPPVPQPPVEPLVLLEMTPDRAREINGAVPFVDGRMVPARAFTFAGTPVDRAAARACLASAAWYEAGDDPVGQAAVVQVVLNRLRHPAYPKTVCGVVFQGSERSTGCQFSFTCDGAMTRRPSAIAWERANGVADKALDGGVDKTVGNATHYHTDWVVPYWSATLDKIARVGTHLFFRWRGYWGTPAAFRGRYLGGEVVDPRVPGFLELVTVDGVSAAGEAIVAGTLTVPSDDIVYLDKRPAVNIPGVSAAALQGHQLRLGTPAGPDYALELAASGPADGYPIAAAAVCRDLPACTVAGWTDPARMPDALPIRLSVLRTATFLYRKRPSGLVQAYWNCRQSPRVNPAECLPGGL